jgi:hypothetical protein
MKPEDLQKVIDTHAAWLRGGAGSERADLRRADLRDAVLRRADLRGADLRDADLRDADLRGADLRRADLGRADLRGSGVRAAMLTYPVFVTPTHVHIGCERLTHQQWHEATEATVHNLDGERAVEALRTDGPVVNALIEAVRRDAGEAAEQEAA